MFVPFRMINNRTRTNRLYDQYEDDYYNDLDYYYGYSQDYEFQLDQIDKSNQNLDSFDYLLSIPYLVDSDDNNPDENTNNISLKEFKKRNIDNLKEDLIYYFSSPESILHFKSSLEKDINYEYYINLDCRNFLIAQKVRFKKILSISKPDSEIQKKISKLSNFNNSFCSKLSLVKDNEKFCEEIKNANLIGMKIDEGSFLFSENEFDENKIIKYLNELKDIFCTHTIEIESIGFVQFNFIEKNLIFILQLIEKKFDSKNNIKNMNTIALFIVICIDLLKSFKSTKLYFYIIRFLNHYKDFYDLEQINLDDKELIQFIPNNCFDFSKFNHNIKKVLVKDLKKQLINKGVIKEINEIKLDTNYCVTFGYDDYILLFIKAEINSENDEEKNKINYYIYYKIDLINKNVIDAGKIDLSEGKKDTNLINISLKKEFIFIFYIVDISGKYYLKCKIYNKYSINMVKEDKIELKDSFIPINLYNDNKYIYCISKTNEIFMIKRKYKIDYKNYINCSYILFESDLIHYKEINDLSEYEMYNSLYMNNIFFLNNKTTKEIFIGKFIIDKNKKYILNIYEMSEETENRESIKIAYNDNRFILTKINNRNDENILFYELTSKDFNDLIDKGISLLPFNSKISNYNYSPNLYEYLVHEYSCFLNLCGNFELINVEKEKYLINYPFSLCFNFDQNILSFIIDEISNNNNDNILLNFIIILKQIICLLHNVEILNEEKIQKIIPYFKKLILNMIKSKKYKMLNKIIKEILEISSYMKNNAIIDITDIKFIFDKDFNKNNIPDINISSKLLLIELIIKQNTLKNSKELYEFIILLEFNYLKDILKNESFDLSNYNLIKQFMINISESLLKNSKIIYNDIISLIPCLLENIQILFELYQKKVNDKCKYLEEYSFIYNSFIFRVLYFIIEYLISNKILLRKNEYIIILYKILLLFDKNNINFNDCFDMNNLIEIKDYTLSNSDYIDNYSYGYNRNSAKIIIKLKTASNIVIRTNLLSEKEIKKLNSSTIINIISSSRSNPAKFTVKGCLYREVEEINIEFRDNNRSNNKNNAIINIVPLKDENLFKLYNNNKDYKIISLIEQSIIHYLLSLFEDINSKLEEYNDDKTIKSYRKMFQKEIFKYMSIPINNSMIIRKSSTKFNNITNEFLEKINKNLDKIEDLDIIRNELIKNFNIINKEIYQNKIDLKKNYEDEISNSILQKKNNTSEKEIKCEKLFKVFNYDLSLKNFIAKQINENKKLNCLITQIFLFGIKYYNCFPKLNRLRKEIEKYNIDDINDIKKNLEQIRLLENYSLFYSFYEESSNIIVLYHEHKKKFNDSNFEKENKRYFDENMEKIEFFYSNIIPCDDLTIKPNNLIIKNLIELIDNSDIGIYEIIQFSKIKNLGSQIKLIELTIINNLLLYLKNESNIILLLNLINKNMHTNKNSILKSMFDNTYGTDYFNVEKLKIKFHLFLKILSNKITNNNKNYSITTNISLIESLILKIKGRNFPILFEILKIFDEIKTIKINDEKDGNLFIFENKNAKIYNVTYYNEIKYIQCKFNIFKILIYEIMKIIKKIVKYRIENENELFLERNPSNILDIDFKKIFEKILSFFVDINPECFYYDDLILFFYKIFINSKDLLNYAIINEPNVLYKIMKISFGKDHIIKEENTDDIINNNKNKINHANDRRLIMLKLLCIIIENIKEENLYGISEIIQKIENNNIIIQKPLIYLYENILKELNDNKNCLDVIIKKYLKEMVIILINKIIEFEEDENISKSIIDDNKVFNIFLFDDIPLYISENQFILESHDPNTHKNFENYALFNNENNKSVEVGKIICFVDNQFINYASNSQNYSFEIAWSYDNHNKNNIFDRSSFLYSASYINDKNKNAIILMKDFEQLDFYDISNLEIKNVSELEIIDIDSKYKISFLEKKTKLIINRIKDELINDKLNDKGIYLILKVLQKLIKYIPKDELILLFEYIYKFYNRNKLNENNYPFMSYEFIENKVNKYFQFKNIKNIYKEKEDNSKSTNLFSLFNYKIKDYIIEINRNTELINKNFKANLFNPNNLGDIFYGNDAIKKIYNGFYELSSISYYIKENNNTYYSYNDNSILFTKTFDNEILQIVTKNINKIKVVIVVNIIKDINQDKIIDFVINNDIPIYKLENKDYDNINNFFIKGKSKNYNLYSNQYISIENLFSVFKLNFDKKSDIEEPNPMENILKKLSKFKYNKIINDNTYKSKLCKNYRSQGLCPYADKCIFAHGEEEKKEIENIRNYLNNRNEEEEKQKKFQSNINKLYRDLKNEEENIFTILNIKLSKRLIFDILNRDCIKSSDIDNIFGDIENIAYIYDTLYLEYYFNIENNISNRLLSEKLLSYFSKLSNENKSNLRNNKWILYYFKQISKINNQKGGNILSDLNPNRSNTEKKLMEILNFCPNIINDKLLFLIGIISKTDGNEYFIKYYFDIINKMANSIVNLDSQRNESENNLEYLLLINIINILYNYYNIKKKDKENGTIEMFNKDIDETMKKLLQINIDCFFPKHKKDEDIYNYNNTWKKMSKQTSLKIDFIFKYLDLILILLYREDLPNFYNYMVNPENILFKYYFIYKILSMEKSNKNDDYKETSALIYYIISSNNEEKNKNQINEDNIEVICNTNNEYKFKNKQDLYDISFKFENIISEYNKLLVLCLDEKNEKYYYQNIIDLNNLSIYDNIYKLRCNNNIYLVPLKNISTSLYSIGSNSNDIYYDYATYRHKKDNFQNLNKYEKIPKYCWNIGYDGKNNLMISEDDNKVYNFIEKNNSLEISLDKRLDSINNKDNKTIGFINGNQNYPSFIHKENGDFFLINENNKNYKWLNEKIKLNMNSPILIPNVKIVSISANYNECYAVGDNGKLYENIGKDFMISQIDDISKFLQCACGEEHIICLVKNNKGKGIVYAKGNNFNEQCGFNYKYNSNIAKLTKCEINDELDFKFISATNDFSAAISSCGKLCVWGLYNGIILMPKLVNENHDIIVDKIFLRKNILYAIGRKLEKGKYITKLFSLGTGDRNYYDLNYSLTLKEIELIDKENNNSQIIPIKILIRENKTYFLGINENKLIEEINEIKEKNEINEKIKISISYKIQSPKIEYNLEKLKKIYSSENLNKFIYLFNSLSDKNIKDLIMAFDELKKEDIKTKDIYYNELITYLQNKDDEENNELLSFFINNEKNEGIILFNYLKKRIALIEENFMNFINIDKSLKSDLWINKIFEQNIIYLNDNSRVQYFYSLLLNMENRRYHRLKKELITMDRLVKAGNFKEKYNENKIPDIHLNETIFGQLFHILGENKGEVFLLEKGQNLFSVKLKGEDAIDQGGPYREILSDICDELQSDYIELFIKTPNNKNNIGELRDKYIINPDANNINYNKAFEFIGKLIILSISSGEPLNLNLHPIVWKMILENKITFKEYKTIDNTFYNMIKNLEEGLSKKDHNLIDLYDLNFVIKNSNGSDIKFIEHGQEKKVTLDNVKTYIDLAKSKRLDEINNQIKYIKEGLYSGIEKNIIKILNWKQLEERVCGNPIFDIDDFKKHTKCDEKRIEIQWFWEWLESCKEEDKFKYLKFVSGRSRLPKSDYKHEINVIDTKNQLPKSHTCFSSLDLPKYDSKEILFEKMKYAIENVTTINDS